jgi:hypothetical protein
MEKEKLIEQIMELVDRWESTEKSEFIREQLLPCLPAEVLKAILTSQQK